MITIDVSPAVHSRAGMGRYAEKIAIETAKVRDVSLFHNQGSDGKMPAALTHLPTTRVMAGYKPWRMGVLLAQMINLRLFSFDGRLPGTTLFHATEHLLLPLKRIPTIITIHDIIPHLFPQYHTKLNYYFLKIAMPLFCKRATAIITVSEASKRDLIEHFHVPAKKIHVIYEAAAEHFTPPTAEKIAQVRQEYQLPANYLLHISTIEPRKNLDRLVDALLILRANGHPDLTLVLAGAKGWLFQDFFKRLEDEGLTDIVISPGWVEDEDLPALIAGARLGVQPSLYEGFGLPILEHMACGQVVAASDRSSLPEVGGDAAVYFDPENVSEMSDVIDKILSSPAEYKKRQALGLAQSKKFSWEKTAAETIAVYDLVRENYANQR